jgi:ACS family hexuronate transporter-like MFS transporter
MFAAAALWTLASASHAWMAGLLGFAVARAALGFGEGATFPGGLRTAMDSLPPRRQSRGIAISYSGGSLGAILTPIMVVPIAGAFGWRAAFLVTGALGILWLLLWWSTARPPFLPAHTRKPGRIVWPNLRERRFWSLALSYSLCAIAIGPILYLAPLYLNRVLGVSQAGLGRILWVPPLGWEVGYFFWGWAVDRYASGNPRPVGWFALLAALGLPLALVTRIASPIGAVVMFFWAMFVAGGFVVLALRTAAFAYPREQTALVAGIGAGAWSALVAVLLPVLGGWFDRGWYGATFLLVCLLPVAGAGAWWALNRAPINARIGMN